MLQGGSWWLEQPPNPGWCTHLPVPIYLAPTHPPALVQKLTLRVLVAQGSCPHVTEPQGTLAAAVDKEVAMVGMELGCCDHLREVFHVGWLDVDDIWVGEVKGNSEGAFALSLRKAQAKPNQVWFLRPPTPATNTPVPSPPSHILTWKTAVQCPFPIPAHWPCKAELISSYKREAAQPCSHHGPLLTAHLPLSVAKEKGC